MAKTPLKKQITNWIKKNRLEVIILGLILLIGAVMRLYRISEYMTFLGDEGRDVIVVRRLLTDFDPILVGPGTSIGNMYLGPLYYYLMAPALLLANFSPVGPAVMIALLGVATIFFVWFVAREWFGKGAAFIGALLYAISSIVIIYSRSSWNPNVMPFFSLLTIYSVWQFWEKQKYTWLIVTSISMAFVLQSHYLGLLLIPVIIVFWLITYHRLIKNKENKRQGLRIFISYSLSSAILFLVLMSPLVIFDARHEWRNFAAIKTFFTQRQSTVSARPWNAIPKLWPLTQKVVTRLVLGTKEVGGGVATKIFVIFVTGAVLVAFIKIKFEKDSTERRRLKAYSLLITWMIFGLVGLGLYKQEIYDHYFGFFFTAPFLLIGGVFQETLGVKRKAVFFFVFFWILVFLYILVSINLHTNPLRTQPNRQLQRTIEVVKAVSKYSEGKPFNFAVIAERNYEGAYMYFFEMWDIPAYIPIADILDETLKDQLFVVCEVTGERCNPETNERPELANFGWRKVVASWNVSGVTIYKVIHSQ